MQIRNISNFYHNNNTAKLQKKAEKESSNVSYTNSFYMNFTGIRSIIQTRRDKKAEIEDFRKQLLEKGFSKDEREDILKNVNSVNIRASKYIFANEDFPKDEVVHIFPFINEKNFDVVPLIFCERQFPIDRIIPILASTNNENIEAAKFMLVDKDFPRDKITGILNRTNSDNIDVAKKMILNKKFPRDKIEQILSYTKKENSELASLIVNDDYFKKSDIWRIVKTTDKENIESRKKMYDFLKSHEDEFGHYYSRALGKILLYTNPESFDSKIKMYDYLQKYRDASRGYEALLAKAIERANDDFENNIKSIIDIVEDNKEKFGCDFKQSAASIIYSGEVELLEEYLAKPEWHNNKVLRELIGDIIEQKVFSNDERYIDKIAEGNFKLDEIIKLKKLGFEVGFEKLQNKNGEVEVVLRKMAYPQLYQEKTGEETDGAVVNVIRLNKDGGVIKSRSETTYSNSLDEAYDRQYFPDGNYSLKMLYKKGKKNYYHYGDIRLVQGHRGHFGIYKTELSDIMDGVYDVTFYDLNDFNEDEDVIGKIKNGEIEGQKISHTFIEPNGDIVHRENFFRNECRTQREYRESSDGNKTSLDYVISDLEGKKLLDVHRVFEFNKNSSITILNGKKYTVQFDNNQMTAKIKDDYGFKRIINFGEKIMSASEKEINLLWGLIKKTPADLLLDCDNIENIIKHKDNGSWAHQDGGILRTDIDLGVFAHELGHYRDLTDNGKYPIDSASNLGKKLIYSEASKISQNPKLIKIYTEEMEEFKRNVSEFEKEHISYFTQTGGGQLNDGLSEFVAEVNMLCTTQRVLDLQTRSFYLMKYFPKTISKAAELLGY